MNAEIGHFALILALAVAIFQMIVPMIGAQKGWSGWIDSARPAALAQFGLIGISFAALTMAFVSSDFSVKLVWNFRVLHKRRTRRLQYRLIAEARNASAASS